MFGDEELRAQLTRHRVLADAAHAFAQAITDHDVLIQLVAERVAVAGNDTCALALLTPDGDSLEVVAINAPNPEHAMAAQSLFGKRLSIGEGSIGMVAKTGLPLMTTDADERVLSAELGDVTSLLVVPLSARGAILGALVVLRHGERPPHDGRDRDLIGDLATRAALALDNARYCRELERRVAERTTELEVARRELDTFSYSVSHDLRAPLRAIDGFAKILVEDHAAALDDDARRVVDVVCKNAERMGDLIDALLEYSRIGRASLTFEPADMTALARSAADEVCAHAQRPNDLEIPALPTVRCSAPLIRQVWIQLLGNAIKFSRDRPPGQITVEARSHGREVIYAVRDNGVGFDMRYADKLFGVFQRLHDPKKFDGTGVGLALVQRIVARHGGRVWGEGKPDGGATFSFALPRIPGRP